MKVSLYTFVRNTRKMDYHAVHMLKHHSAFFDEIVVHEGESSDDTLESISSISDKIKVFSTDWDRYSGMEFIRSFKDLARRECTGDWCVMLDSDEFIPEWCFENLRKTLQSSTVDVLPMSMVNFYGNYRVFCREPEVFRWPAMKMCIHRNIEEIEFVGGDSSSINRKGHVFSLNASEAVGVIHHFGFVRNPARLRENWRNMRGRLYNAKAPRFRLPSWVFDLLPHRWDDPSILPYLGEYEGSVMQIVESDPNEFVRDGFKVLKLLRSRGPRKQS